MKLIYAICLITLSFNLFSQRSKDGTPTIAAANTIVNNYTPLTSNIIAGATTLNVGSSASFSPGDLIFIIQMQGVTVNAYDGGSTGPWFDSNSALPTDTSFGRILNYFNTGMNEFAEVNSVPNGTSIIIDCGLKNSYDVTKNFTTPSGKNINLLGNVQVIRVPRYNSLTLSGSASISCLQWNGSIGGIAVVEVENNTVLNTVGSFSVTGKGFRGGTAQSILAVNGGDKYGANKAQEGGYKGESIAGDSGFYRNYASVFARGAMANGGGGGNTHNAGGGGGSNGHSGINYNGRGNPIAGYAAIWNLETTNFSTNTSSGGGRGGYSFSNSNQNLSTVAPGTYSTGVNAWGGDMRRAVGGFGGRPLDYSSGRLFLGGGGGAGHGNNNKAGGGGNGGGMVYLVCYGNLSGSGTIVADGDKGANTNLSNDCADNDAGGGGGGGGTVILKVNGTISLTTTPAISAKGGDGGNVNYGCPVFLQANNNNFGPGASGGGGYVASSGTLPSNTIIGGTQGIVTGLNNNIVNNFPPNGATKGGSGGTGAVTAYTLNTSTSQTLCTNQAFTVTASSTEPGTSINWYNTLVGGSAIATGTAYASSGYPSAGTYTLFAGACTGTYRRPIIITVSSGLSMTINSPTICPGQTVTLTASGATSYTWNTGATTNTINVSPSSTSVYSVNGISSLCSGSKTTTVTVSPSPTISVANATICSGNSATLSATGATSYTWLPGGQTTTSISITPTITTTYTITGSNGACSNTTTANVSVNSLPILTTNTSTICPGQTATFTVSGATSYTWNPGNVTGSTFTISPVNSTTVSVKGANGTCTTQVTSSVTISPNPTITVSNQTICPSQSATLTASGATTYTWNTGVNTNSISVSPISTTVYTVNGTLGTCSSNKTVTVTIAAQPTISVSNATICSGNSATLSATGAISYTWLPGGQSTASISVTPTINSTYSITGSNGTCSKTNTVNVIVNSTPTLTANSVTICPSQTATLTVSGATTYTWIPNNSNATSFTISPVSNTVVTVIGANGTCTSQATPSVTIGTGISISVNNPTICPGQTATLTANGATSYTWNTGANSNTLIVNPSSTSIYTINGTSGACSGTKTSTVTVASLPAISAASATICSGNSAILSATGATSYTWLPGGQSTASISVTPTINTTYTITGSNGLCTNTTTATANITQTPTLTANSTTICAGQTTTLTVSGALSYTWVPGNINTTSYTLSPLSNTLITVIGANGTCTSQATPSVTIGTGISISVNSTTICAGQNTLLTATGATSYTWNTGVNTSTLNVNPNATSIYTISGSNGSCIGTNTATVTVNTLPILSVNSTSICSGQSATLTANGANTYTWSNGTNGNSLIVSPTSSSIYTLSGTGANGCISASITSATINVTPTPTLSVNSSSICSGQTATLSVSGANSYTWSTNQNTSSINISPTSTTTYSVSGSNGVCNSSATATVSVDNITLTTYSIAIPICPSQTVTLLAGGSNTATTTYTWSNGLNTYSQTVLPINTTTYVVNGTSLSGCPVVSGTITVNVDALNANLSSNNQSTITLGETIQLTNASSGETSILWTYFGGNSTNNQLSITPTDTGFYCVQLLAINATCRDSITDCIRVIGETKIIIPNVFTPNGDNKNDVFKINTVGIKTLTCTIYDRWGLKLYEWEGINGSWDGNSKSGSAADGTYFYIINYTDQKDKSITEKGFLTLFKD